MPAEKPPYQLKIKLTSMRPDAIARAIETIKDLMSDYDSAGEASATVTIDTPKYAPIESIMDDFEAWLVKQPIGLEAEMTIKRPGIKPETMQARMRASHRTPIDDMLRDALEEE
jgi:hypothetical protein